MSSYHDIDPQDIDPDTGRPYANYSSPALDTSFHDGEMAIDDSESSIIDDLAGMVEMDPEYEAEEAADRINDLIRRARAIKAEGAGA